MADKAEIFAALKQLEKEDGRLTPEDVVKAAEDEDSPLHGCFTWDNDAAAHQFRLVEARRLIRTVKVTVTVSNVQIMVPRYVRDPEQAVRIPGYQDIVRIQSDEDKARGVVLAEMKRVSDAAARAKHLAHYLSCQDLIDTIERTARSVTRRIEGPEDPAVTQ